VYGELNTIFEYLSVKERD